MFWIIDVNTNCCIFRSCLIKSKHKFCDVWLIWLCLFVWLFAWLLCLYYILNSNLNTIWWCLQKVCGKYENAMRMYGALDCVFCLLRFSFNFNIGLNLQLISIAALVAVGADTNAQPQSQAQPRFHDSVWLRVIVYVVICLLVCSLVYKFSHFIFQSEFRFRVSHNQWIYVYTNIIKRILSHNKNENSHIG